MLKGLSLEYLEEKYRYDPETGDIFARSTGKLLGSLNKRGYVVICCYTPEKVLLLQASRLAWVLYYKEPIPDGMVIDHIDHDPQNNRIENLRCITSEQNIKNLRYKKRPPKIHDRYVETQCSGILYDKKYSCYIVYTGGKPTHSTYCYEDAKKIRWEWEFNNNYMPEHGLDED